MSTLSFRLLGTPEIRHGGELMRFATRKTQALLIYLAVEGGLHSRDKLMALLYPESDQELARAALRNTLTRLRSALGSDAGAHLVIDGTLVGLQADAGTEIDLWRMEALSDSRRGAVKPPVDPFELTRGMFLEGFSLDDSIEFDDWMTVQRQRWDRVIELALERLSAWQQEQGQFSEAVETCLCWIAHNPTQESAYLRLMALYATLENQSAALTTYERYRQLLFEEVGAEPSRDLTELYRQIRSGSYVPPRAHWKAQAAAALAFVADDALFINPGGGYVGIDRIRENLEHVVRIGIRFDLRDFRVEGCRIIYQARVFQGGETLDEMDDGLTLVTGGKIVFDGTLRSIPKDLLRASASFPPDEHALVMVKAFYQALNGDDLA